MSESPETPTPPTVSNIETLVASFRDFNEAAANLNLAYNRLEERLAELSHQLEAKDRELYGRLRELDRVSRYLSSLVESLSSGVVAIDLDGKISIFNRSIAEMISLTAEEVIGKAYADVFGQGDNPSGALQTLLTGPELRGIERILPGGTRVLCRTLWVVDSLGERVGVMEVLDDITMVRNLEERVQQQKTLAAMGEMAAAVAHELRNPLAGIGGFAAILQEELSSDVRLGRMAGKIVQGVENLDRVATNLLFLTRPTVLKPESFDLCGALAEICDLLQIEATARQSKILVSAILPKERVAVWADPNLLRLIFGNLGKNALQAVGDEGSVTMKVIWQLLANRVEVEICDTGCGIAPEHLPKVFFPFYTTKHSGTGLGLALVKKAVDLHHGEISVESSPGVGTSFRVSLPIRVGAS